MLPKVKNVSPLPNYKIFVHFQDDTKGEFDLFHLVGKGVFKFWDSYENFEKVYINQESGAISWNEDIDIDSLTIYARLKNQPINTFLKTAYAQN